MFLLSLQLTVESLINLVRFEMLNRSLDLRIHVALALLQHDLVSLGHPDRPARLIYHDFVGFLRQLIIVIISVCKLVLEVQTLLFELK